MPHAMDLPTKVEPKLIESKSSWSIRDTLSPSLGFLPDLEGIRGMAILFVLISHSLPLSNLVVSKLGPSGVAIFFALSGFLITGVLLHHAAPRYRNLPLFYGDRFVRLFPQLFLVVVTGAALCMLRGYSLDLTARWSARAILYLENTTIWAAPPKRTGPFYSTWSLAVEEWFYATWSLALPFIARRSPRWRTVIMITLVFYFGHVQYHAAQKKDAYYGLINAYKALPANLHKMLAGAMLRLIPLPNFMFSRYSSYLGLSGLIILFTYIQIANHAPWHTFNIVTLCTIPLLTGAIEHQNFVFNLRILRFFGRISYALYLWHEVFIFFIRVHRGWQAVGCVVMATIFSTILTTYYEEPLRKAWRKSAWRRTLQERAEEGNDGVYSSMGSSNMAYAPLRTEDTSITTSSSEEDLSFISVINEKEHL